jgi:hypothetical protein
MQLWLQFQSLQVLDCPPQLPDLSPIEHSWGILKRKLGSYESAPANLDELWRRVQLEYKNITPDRCYNLIASMPKKIKVAILAEGGYTNYENLIY